MNQIEISYQVDLAQEVNVNDFNSQFQQNLGTILVSSITFTPTAAPTTGARRRQLQSCNGTVPLSVMIPSYGMSEAQILAALEGATSDALFTVYAGQVCSYALNHIAVVDATAPPTSRQCIFPCMADYISDRLACSQQDLIMPKVNCVLAARQKKKACMYNAISTLCVF